MGSFPLISSAIIPAVKYEVILLDCGGTLTWPHFGRFNQIMSDLRGQTIAEEVQYRAFYRSTHALDDYLKRNGSYPAQDSLTLNHWVFEKGLELEGHPGVWTMDCTMELIRRDGGLGLWDHTYPWIEDALQKLQAAGYRLSVVSNADGRVAQLLERLGYAKYFETIVDSTVEGVAKPDPRLFYIGLERMGLSAMVGQAKLAARGEAPSPPVLYVGDSYRNDFVGSQNAGLPMRLVDPLGLFSNWDAECVADMRVLAEELILKR